jgi:glutamate formiminotransferase/glutamate formiminotransferase/formiminotetrahydrofolate cyclodeaminase
MIVECVPNFSEGRDAAVVAALAHAGAPWVIHQTSDTDHNRSVLSLAGPPEEILDSAVALAREAARLIDLRTHAGVHPRIGALDVLPFVPLEGAAMDDCVALAHRAGERIWTELGIPVYFYEFAALREACRNLADVRKQLVPPDLGGEPHPSAGCMAVGARKVLIAYNVNLRSGDLGAARAIARTIRQANGGLAGVKALGLALESRGLVQVSMNLVDYELTPPHVAFLAIQHEARAMGIEVESSELIGLIPRRALEMAEGVDLRWENLTPESVLENRVETRLKPPNP